MRLDGETVLARAIRDIQGWAPPLILTKVGIVANWEWGLDSGSRFSDFVGWRPHDDGSPPSGLQSGTP